MQKISRKILPTVWFIEGIFHKFKKNILISFLIGLCVVIAIFTLKPFLNNYSPTKHKKIGLVGVYTPSNLPLYIQNLISSGLTEVKDNGEAMPGIAQSWEISDDKKTYTFKLKNDIYWHDGKKLTASDINYQLKDVEFTVLDGEHLRVKLKEPFSPLPIFLSKPLFKKGLIGVGQYKISAISLTGETVALIKLDPISGDLPILEIKFYGSQIQAKTAFMLGEVNMLDDVSDVSPFDKWGNISIKENVQYNQYLGIFFNLNDQFLKQKEVRQGLAFAINKPGKNRIATPISTQSWAYTNRVKQYDLDLDQAKKLLSGNQVASGSAITLSAFAQNINLAQQIADSWKKVGVATKVKIIDTIPSDYQALLLTQEIPLDPDQYTLWHSTQTPPNLSHYASPKIDKLLEDGRKESDQEKRKKIYFEFQKYLVEDAPAVFLNHPVVYTIGRK